MSVHGNLAHRVNSVSAPRLSSRTPIKESPEPMGATLQRSGEYRLRGCCVRRSDCHSPPYSGADTAHVPQSFQRLPVLCRPAIKLLVICRLRDPKKIVLSQPMSRHYCHARSFGPSSRNLLRNMTIHTRAHHRNKIQEEPSGCRRCQDWCARNGRCD